ncbi:MULTISPECIES: nucleotidyltransferase domain-containing protein [unclassified Mucilaginibacter]|uniref:DNA polymerase beta superfamily protein n=1 Tax=unclassified Mucilaginibacter TaxID=2617802 RepID=UPI002AC8B540|nr:MULTISPECIES: nucleotidyltransferase domain-containing protein [unclassified Mucilaginibacter]MEB0263600.1 nucleotidyltransferase domain-containing protein [Mucilaginibacter sp. 10I4]MEB0278022.1 nucleotidyltransferase domain-containing protein [Mucilaginibacter sp. 10B2]MEB0299625.1 nucleotidyltransferase domain-containing protein [Mucilaginibacter sp. 5C4]WPX22911.1 nucleotidyltransferase domain-containing protein [Mucilaginibacter sp. 5C4]
MTYEQLINKRQYILLDCVSGSNAYNLSLPTSDIDKKGIFILPQKELYGFNFQDQVANNTNDEVYFEIGRFLELLGKNNPNILELLNTPEQHVIFRHPIMDLVKPSDYLSKLCRDTFAGYAQTQIKKAKGLNKKINNPIDKEKKSVLDFCYVIQNSGSALLTDWLEQNALSQETCGLVNVEHFRNVYLLYSQAQVAGSSFNGIVSGSNANDVQLSSVPKALSPLATMTFNKDAYSIYCRNYKEYLEWEEKRNQVRYESTLSHGKSYDAKNMMHTFRLLNMAEEIALYKEVRVHRQDRDFLLSIRSGAFEFDELMGMIDEKMHKVDELYKNADLPEQPDVKTAEDVLVQIRERFYK